MKKILALLFALLLFAAPVFSAPLVTESGNAVMVSNIDADFTYTTSCMMATGAKIDWIMFMPADGWGLGHGGSYVTIKDGADDGPIIFYAASSDLTEMNFQPIYYHGTRLRPVIDFSVSSVAHDESVVIFKLWK